MKIIYVNCRLRNKYDSDLRCNEHYISGSDSKAWKNEENRDKNRVWQTAQEDEKVFEHPDEDPR